MTAYYSFLNREDHEDGSVRTFYRAEIHAQGAWNPHEQYMAPATGILCHELELFQQRNDVRIGRISLDIFGLISFGDFSITTRMIRKGKTIELIEAEMRANGKTCIVARAWRMMTQDTSDIAGLEDHALEDPDHVPVWEGMQGLNNMVEGQHCSDFVHIMGLVDTANGIVPRQNPQAGWAYPNLDLQIHMHRLPKGEWLGIEAVQQYGDDGIGLTSAVLHDTQGAFGRSEQILTLRPLSSP